ncbi:H-NS histone family protein [Allopseudospirillum japonicum]|uniref:H-NS histone family protein n=1 Tax=Allopseudospirillum japonicum TaxID=64971 RepID=A0A1H6TCX6_9GAMM|nr:histone-like nucleoid-structuring protein, MvaT/MvaU family [Allopseudospirillum japonicum]SEI74140.1 H-NS histone family protein [Allopseudospirillum japonicum]
MNKIHKLREFLAKEKQLQALQQEVQHLAQSTAVQEVVKFKQELQALMEQFNLSEAEVLDMLRPPATQAPAQESVKYQRAQKIFRNPHTGETLEIRSRNHAKFQAWKRTYGDEVETWLVS